MKVGFALSKGIEDSPGIEEFIRKDLPLIWEKLNTVEKTNLCRGAYHSVINLIQREKPDIAVLFAHLLWYRNESFFITLDPRTVGDKEISIRPVGVITLIDDIYQVRERIRNRSSKSGPRLRVNFTLEELAVWRDFEILLSDMLTEHILGQSRGFHYIWAIKHPISSLWSLIAKPERLVVYSAFPISSTRGHQERMDDIDQFRARLYEHFVVSDPLTIDEYPLLQKLHNLWKDTVKREIEKKNTTIPDGLEINFDFYLDKCTICDTEYDIIGNKIIMEQPFEFQGTQWNVPPELLLPLDEQIELTHDNRWPLYPRAVFRNTRPTIGQNKFVVSIPAWEVMIATRGINSQIRTRDFRLIERADAIVAFRPNYKRLKISDGVKQEIRFALELRQSYGMNLDIITIWPSSEDGAIPKAGGAFGGGAASEFDYASPMETLDEAIEQLERKQEEKRNHFMGWKTPSELAERKRTWAFLSTI